MTDATFNEEVQLLDWGETRSGGPWVKVRLADSELLNVFRGLDTATLKASGHRFQMLLFDADQIEQIANAQPEGEPEEKGYGYYWREIFRQGVFNAPDILWALGTDDQFQDYVRHHKSCVSGEFQGFVAGTGKDVCIYAHVRRASNSGTGIKPVFSGVPLTDLEHKIQHNEGELALLQKHEILPNIASVDTAKAWFDKKAAKYRADWARSRLHDLFGVDSCADIEPERFIGWCEQNDLTRYLPSRLRVAA